MKRLQTFIATMLTLLLIAGSANAVSIKGRDVSTIPDILRWSRGLTGKETSLELRKDSLFRLIFDADLDLRYNIGNGDNTSSLGTIKDALNGSKYVYSLHGNLMPLALAQTKFNGNKVLIAPSKVAVLTESQNLYDQQSRRTSYIYDLYFLTVGKNDNGGGGGNAVSIWCMALSL